MENVIPISNTNVAEQPTNNNSTNKANTKTPGKKNTQKLVIINKEYTQEQLHNTIRNKYQEHQNYYKVIQDIVNKIVIVESNNLDKVIDQLSDLVTKMDKLTIAELEKFAIQIPIFMYKLNTRLGKKGLEANISNHLKNYEITSNLLTMVGGSGPERQKAAEYNAMVSTFTTEIKNQVYLNLKTKMDLAKTVNDGVKKALSAQIEEMKLTGGSSKFQP